MGGSALSFVTRRVEKKEYNEIALNVSDIIDFNYKIYQCDVIKSYHSKESFGDLDILYTTYDETPLTVDSVHSMFPTSREIKRNTNVISFEYSDFQIDLIHSMQNDYEYAKNYFSFNDLGNITGRVAKRFGLKHGHRGLTLPLRDGNNVFDEVVITKNFHSTLEFLDLDLNKFDSGFDTVDDILNYVASSKWYHPDLYKLENLNHIARTRDKKRPTYNAMLTFGETFAGNTVPIEKNKELYLPLIFDFFPSAYPSFQEKMSSFILNKVAKTKYNGKLVSEVTGMTAKELGEFMASIKPIFNNTDVCYYSDETIRTMVLNEFRKNHC